LSAQARRRITQDEYDKKAREPKERQSEIALRIEQHQKAEGDFRTTLEGLIFLLATNSDAMTRSAGSPITCRALSFSASAP